MRQPRSSFGVEPADAGKRLDLFVFHHLNLTRNQVKRRPCTGAILFNRRVATEQHRGLLLSAGSTVGIEPDVKDPATVKLQPALPLLVLNQAPGRIAVDKPPRMPVHPLRSGETHALLTAVV